MFAAVHGMHGSWGVATAVRWCERTTIVDSEYVTRVAPVPDDEVLGGATTLVDAASGLEFRVKPPWNAPKSAGYTLVPVVPRDLQRNYHPTPQEHEILVSFDQSPSQVAELVNIRLPRYRDLLRQAREERANGDRAMDKAIDLITTIATRISGVDNLAPHPPRRQPDATGWYLEVRHLYVRARANGNRIGVTFSLPVNDFEANVAALAAVIRP